MKHRNIILIILLSILTLGLYDIYWFIKTTNAFNHYNSSLKLPSYTNIILFSLLVVISPILLIISTKIVYLTIVYILLATLYFAYLSYNLYWSYLFYRKADFALGTKLLGLSFVLSVFFTPVIGIIITQNSMNKIY